MQSASVEHRVRDGCIGAAVTKLTDALDAKHVGLIVEAVEEDDFDDRVANIDYAVAVDICSR